MLDLAKPAEPAAPTDLFLARRATDPTLYEVPGFGTIRAGGVFGGPGSTITIDGVRWHCSTKRGLVRLKHVAVNPAGKPQATFAGPKRMPGRGTIRWDGRRFGFRSATRGVRVLTEGGVDLVELTGLRDPATPVRGRLAGGGSAGRTGALRVRHRLRAPAHGDPPPPGLPSHGPRRRRRPRRLPRGLQRRTGRLRRSRRWRPQRRRP